jgi:hypothetical protein
LEFRKPATLIMMVIRDMNKGYVTVSMPATLKYLTKLLHFYTAERRSDVHAAEFRGSANARLRYYAFVRIEYRIYLKI